MDFLLSDYLSVRKELVDAALNEALPDETNYPPVIFQAVRYSLFAGGKRLRPILCMAAAEACGGDGRAILPVACALEMIHTYSLIHDDLPAMDDDDFRRGRPTSHKVFGEATAIMAGDALLTEAFALMSAANRMPRIPADRILVVIHEIARAAGFCGMVGGQVVDMQSEMAGADEATLLYIHTHKTGAMIVASVRAGAILVGAQGAEIEALATYGSHVGLAFQIADDILNVEGDRAALGKGTGSDADRGKLTFPHLLGIEASRTRMADLVARACSALQGFDQRADPLRAIARYVVERST
ncbi:MAG: farnesyl diphosphate synthase [Pseudomonadota bacterium]